MSSRFFTAPLDRRQVEHCYRKSRRGEFAKEPRNQDYQDRKAIQAIQDRKSTCRLNGHSVSSKTHIYGPRMSAENEHTPALWNSSNNFGTFAEHGVGIDRSQTARGKEAHVNPDLPWSKVRRMFRAAFSEFLGTFILVMFGDGAVAQVVLSSGEKGNYQSIAWGYVSERR
nr:putative membrane protein [Quercus suber]